MYLRKSVGIKPVIFGLATLFSISSAYSQSSEQTNSIPCLSLSRIQNVDILDNEHLVFQTGVNDYYLNRLPYACHGLRLNASFTYSTSVNQICNVDVISVMNRYGGGYSTGPSCGLGQFVAVNNEDIKALRQELQSQ